MDHTVSRHATVVRPSAIFSLGVNFQVTQVSLHWDVLTLRLQEQSEYKVEFEHSSILPKVLNIINWKALIKKINKSTFSLKNQKKWFKQLVFRL